MTAKEYLNQANDIERKIKILSREIEKMRMLAVSTPAVRYDKERVQASGASDPMAVTVTNILEREDELVSLISQYVAKKKLLESQIAEMDNVFYADVLYGKYVAGLSFFELAHQIGKERRQTIRIHNKALALFREQYGNFFENS